MSILNFIFAFMLCLLFPAGPGKHYIPVKSQIISKIINSQWTFNYFPEKNADIGFESPSLNDNEWTAVSIPHTWSTYETTGELHPFIAGINPYIHTTLKSDVVNNKKITRAFYKVEKGQPIWIPVLNDILK